MSASNLTVEQITAIATQAAMAAVQAVLAAEQPAKAVTQPKAAPKASRRQPKADRVVMATSHTWLGERVGTGSRKLTQANRKSFIADHAWAKPGMSTNTLRSEVAAGRKVNKGWNVAI